MPDYEENFDEIFSPKLSRDDVREEVGKVLRDISLFNAQAAAGQQAAIREVSAQHSDFQARREQMLAVLRDVPILRDAIGAAESNPQLSPTLPALYEVVYKSSFAPSDNNNTAATAEPSQRASSESASETDLSDESTQHNAALASQRVDLSPENRKSLISELERKGVLDIEF